MHVVVVGAGVIGVTTAYYLAEAGHDVTVVDRAAEVADGASYANAGQLSYSFTDALAKPEFIATIPSLLAGRDAGSRVRLAPELIPWGARFLTQCTSKRSRQNTVAVLRTAMRSAQLLGELRSALQIDFSHRAAGKLVLLATDDALRSARASSALKNQNGSDTEILSAKDAFDIEPALAGMAEPITGAVYSRSDEVADSRLFSLRMKEWLQKSGKVTFKLDSTVDPIQKSGGRIRSVRVGDDEIDADAVVVCAGAWSQGLLRPLGINPRIYPVRGYSITLPVADNSPMVSVTVLRRRVVFSRINGAVRIAGFADFNGFSTDDDTKRIDALISIARQCAPQAADFTAAEKFAWGGFRPMTPDGQPRVGPTAIKGLFLNTGHGMLGWTLACASGYDLAQAITDSRQH